MINVITVLRQSHEYTPDKVQIVASMIKRHLTLSHRFICLSDVEVPGVETIPLKHNWGTWYSKFEIFRPDLPKADYSFYLDLDTAIVGSIDSILETAIKDRHDFIILQDFYRYKINPFAMGSGLMFWNNWCGFDFLYKKYVETPITMTGGDQSILEKWLAGKNIGYWQKITNGIGSYKVHVYPFGKVSNTHKIICFHGVPRPWDKSQKIVPYSL